MKTMITSMLLALSVMANAAEKKFQVKEFRSISASSAVRMQFKSGSTYSVRAEGESEDIELYEVKCEGGRLSIRMKNTVLKGGRSIRILGITFGNHQQKPVTFYVTAPTSPTQVELSGASRFETKSTLEGKKMEFDVSGASHIVCATVKAQDIDIDCSGASHVTCSMLEAPEVDIDVSGASHCDASVKGVEVDVDCSGASHCTLDVRCDKINAEASGASRVTLKGRAKRINTEATGASSVNRKELKTE